MRELRRDDSGFTLLELIIVIVIMAIVMVPLVSSFTLGIASTQQAQQDTSNSVDSQLSSIYFDRDAASADTVSTSGSCGGAGTVLQFQWHDGGIDRYAAYVATSVANANADVGVGSSFRLDRVYCENASGPALLTTQIARSMVAAPTVTCDNGSCAGVPTPSRVAMQVKEWGPRATASGCTIASVNPLCFYTFTLAGTRRVTS